MTEKTGYIRFRPLRLPVSLRSVYGSVCLTIALVQHRLPIVVGEPIDPEPVCGVPDEWGMAAARVRGLLYAIRRLVVVIHRARSHRRRHVAPAGEGDQGKVDVEPVGLGGALDLDPVEERTDHLVRVACFEGRVVVHV